MQLHDHMKYIDLGCKMACIPRYQWKGRPTERQLYASEQRIVFLSIAVVLELIRS